MIWYPYEQMKTMREPFQIIDAKGVWLKTPEREMIDSVSSWWSVIHGYKHPALTEAIKAQADLFSHVMLGGLTHEPVRRLSDKLQSFLPGDLDYCFFSDSGSVAVEVALKMALQYYVNQGEWQRTKVLSLTHAYHGDTFKTMEVGDDEDYHFILEAYGEKMEFCQLQINYIDWDFQDAKKKAELLKEYGIPVWVMEPLRGGKLAALSSEDEAALKELRPEEKIPAWAFRFLQSLPEVKMILSGMSTMGQLEENIRTFEEEKPLNDVEMERLLDIADNMINGVPCTACRYCTSHCPQGIDIPAMLKLYNEHVFTGGGFIAPMTIEAIPEEHRPGACVGCQSCEAVCPQQIKISEVLADFVQKLK